MKTKIFLITCVFTILSLSAQDKNKNASFSVKGNCGMCKSRIEKAALKVKGVKYANWSPTSKEFNMVFDENTCSIEKVQKAIVKVGHDIDSLIADTTIYDNLPPCCKYRDSKTMDMDHHKKK
tara:strand:+ start:17266 stop:17631 length:366 start_codon:yes stop_codon:yes gene_type:complete